jgi:hypothetical protein
MKRTGIAVCYVSAPESVLVLDNSGLALKNHFAEGLNFGRTFGIGVVAASEMLSDGVLLFPSYF